MLPSLQSLNAYPVPLPFIRSVAAVRGLDVEGTFTPIVATTKQYRLVVADILDWLVTAPNISQGGQNYSFTDEQRTQFRQRAKAIYDECEEKGNGSKPTYGYKGSRL